MTLVSFVDPFFGPSHLIDPYRSASADLFAADDDDDDGDDPFGDKSIGGDAGHSSSSSEVIHAGPPGTPPAPEGVSRMDIEEVDCIAVLSWCAGTSTVGAIPSRSRMIDNLRITKLVIDHSPSLLEPARV